MSEVKILVVEDEIIIADDICMTLEDLGYKVLEPAINYEDAFEIIQNEKPDLAILDIQLAGKRDGIDLAWKIKEDYDFPFIFLTSNADMMTVGRAKKVNPPAYLIKPFSKEDLYSSIEIALYNHQIKPSEKKNSLLIKDALFVKDRHLFRKIRLEDIYYIKSDHVYIELHTNTKQKYLIRGSLSDLSSRLPKNFYRTHRSYIINVNNMEAINASYVLIDNQKIPISKNYREDLLSNLQLE